MPQWVVPHTVHLLASPRSAGQLPADAELIRTPVPPDSGNFGSVPYPTWDLPALDVSELKVTVHLWVDVEGLVTNYASPSGGCFWFIGVHPQEQEGPLENLAAACPSEPGVVPTGVRELVGEVPAIHVGPLGGAQLAFSVSSYGAYAPGASVEILSGTVDHDSTVTVQGVELPHDRADRPR